MHILLHLHVSGVIQVQNKIYPGLSKSRAIPQQMTSSVLKTIILFQAIWFLITSLASNSNNGKLHGIWWDGPPEILMKWLFFSY